MENEILVSVIIPAYNCEKYIGKAIESALEQNVPLEILIIDDCSADATETVVHKYLDHPHVHYYKNEKNLGLQRAETEVLNSQLENSRFPGFGRLVGAWEAGKVAEKDTGGACCSLQYGAGAGRSGWKLSGKMYTCT